MKKELFYIDSNNPLLIKHSLSSTAAHRCVCLTLVMSTVKTKGNVKVKDKR